MYVCMYEKDMNNVGDRTWKGVEEEVNEKLKRKKSKT